MEEFAAKVQKLAADVQRKVAGHNIKNEAMTKQSLIVPFIDDVLGYKPSEPDEVVTEFTADIGTKQGEKVDYALMHDRSPSIIIECKKVGSDLGKEDIYQLIRYFYAAKARFGILTDGVVYKFFSDLEEQNRMDEHPFFTFNIRGFAPRDVETIKTLKMFTKDEFDKDEAKSAARGMKFLTSIKQVLQKELSEPTEGFLEFIRRRVHEDYQTSGTENELDPLIRQVCKEFIESEPKDDSGVEPPPPHEEFTRQENAALEKVRSLLGDVIDPGRLSLMRSKPASRGVGIKVDNNLRRQVCQIVWQSRKKVYKMQISIADKESHEFATVDGFDAFASAFRKKVAKWV